MFAESAEVPYGAWLVGRKGSLCAGAQYKPLSECYSLNGNLLLLAKSSTNSGASSSTCKISTP